MDASIIFLARILAWDLSLPDYMQLGDCSLDKFACLKDERSLGNLEGLAYAVQTREKVTPAIK